jgi:hypothetical protein
VIPPNPGVRGLVGHLQAVVKMCDRLLSSREVGGKPTTSWTQTSLRGKDHRRTAVRSCRSSLSCECERLIALGTGRLGWATSASRMAGGRSRRGLGVLGERWGSGVELWPTGSGGRSGGDGHRQVPSTDS